jgi:glycosyltransferase involved in cell wall biosynthesis
LLKVVHIAPTDRILGGGERYAYELAKALSEFARVKLITFAGKRETRLSAGLLIEHYPALTMPQNRAYLSASNPMPLTLGFLHEITSSDVVHVHGLRTIVGSMSVCISSLNRRLTCLTDHGGGAFKAAIWIPFLGRSIDLCLGQSSLESSYVYRRLNALYGKELCVIGGGVDPGNFFPRSKKRRNKVLFSGRVVPLKGVEVLIDAVQELETELRIVTPDIDSRYLEMLRMRDKRRRISLKIRPSIEELSMDQLRHL